jgi:predicted RNase H-like HicB family nuclease
MSKKDLAKGYSAVFKCSSDAVEVYFPGLPGCQTCASDMEEAFDFAVDALAAWIETVGDQFIPEKPMTFEEVQRTFRAH